MLQVQVRNGLSFVMPNEHLDCNIKVIRNYLSNVKLFQRFDLIKFQNH